ncbi:MAG: amidase [Sneathiellaceae bacterium]
MSDDKPARIEGAERIEGMWTIAGLARDLATGQETATRLVETCLGRIGDTAGEGGLAFLSVANERARKQAAWVDQARRDGLPLPPFAGIPIAVKDLADIRGEVTGAGSPVLAQRPPAAADAPAVARLQNAGFIVVGRTNMTEFAYSGLGINPHYGTPASPWDRASRRIPGGSSSGSAVAVADGMCVAALGTDTGGSCRIPAAHCGTVGLKSTVGRIPVDGMVPLSPTMDSVGPLANSVACAALFDAVLDGRPEPAVPPMQEAHRLRLAVPRNYHFDGMDEAVAAAFERACSALRAAGAVLEEVTVPAFDMYAGVTVPGGIVAAEAYAWHRPLLEAHRDQYYRHVLGRIVAGSKQSAADLLDMFRVRREAIADFARLMDGFDAMIGPTTAAIAPPIAGLEADDEAYVRTNVLMLRNTSSMNFLDGCAMSLPIHRPGEPAVGLHVMLPGGQDRRLLSLARGIEAAVAPR